MAFNVFREGLSWGVLFEGGGVKRRVKKRSEEWKSLGFDSCFTIEEAREWAKTLTARDKVERREVRRQRIRVRLEEEGLNECAWLPGPRVAEFETRLRTYKVPPKHWSAAKHAILKMGVEPSKWKDYPFRFYDYCRTRGWSLDYVNSIRRAMNCWGEYISPQGYSPIKAPSGGDRMNLMLAYEKREGRSRPSGRLSFALLEKHREKFTPDEYRWLYISRAFGLRPEEMEISLRDPSKHHIPKKRDRFKVYQPKLERSEPNPLKRWKAIKIVAEEQIKALGMIKEGFKRPKSLKKLRDIFGRKLTWYAGRKDFYPAMVKIYGRALVADWMGHSSLDTGKRHYDDTVIYAPGYDEDDEAA